jgi:hypothetical protein
MADNNSTTTGGLLGAAAAGLLSWFKWHSIGYAILHALCGWLYVIYYLIRYGWPG